MNIDMSSALELIGCCKPLAAASLDDDEAAATAQLFKALGDPARIKIVNLLARREEAVCACEIVPAVGLAQATVSHHLKTLTQTGLLEREQRGRWAYYALRPESVQTLIAVVDMKGACC